MHSILNIRDWRDLYMVNRYCRLTTETPLQDDDVETFYDVVESVVEPKIVVARTSDDDNVEIEVIMYEGDSQYVYEIILNDHLNLAEGESITDKLNETFDFDFEFETNLEIKS
jgi:hypothetical protein